MLDVIRSVAIILVITAHIGQTTGSAVGYFFGIPHFYYVSLGGIGVTIFIVTSGLVSELQYGSASLSYGRFMAGRFFRIYPDYYLSLLVGIAVYIYMYYPDLGEILSPSVWVCSITGLHAFCGQWGGPFVTTSWFIGLIMVLYLTFPYLSKSLKRHPHIIIITMLMVSIVSRIILGQYDILPKRPLDWFPLCRIFEFSLGIYLAIMIKQGFWRCINGSKVVASISQFIANISLPLFLVHYPLLSIITFLANRGIPQSIAIVVFLGISVCASWVILLVTNRLPRGLILRKIFGS